MGLREEKVEGIVRDVCANYFYKDLFDQGADILKRVYHQDYNFLDNMHTRRNLLFHLIVGESRRKEPNTNAVEMYSIQLKNDMDNTPNYKEENLGDYLSMMSYYTECEGIDMSNEELLQYYDTSIKYNSNQYNRNKVRDEKKAMTSYIKLKNAEFNKGKLLGNFKTILLVIEDLHKINDMKSISTIRQMLSTIQKIDENLYNNALKIIENTSKLCI